MKNLLHRLEYMGEWLAMGGLIAADAIYVGAVHLGVTFGTGVGVMRWLELWVEGPVLLVATVWAVWAVYRRGHA